MKKFTCTFLSLILVLSALLLPVSAAIGGDNQNPGYGSVTTGEVGFSQSLVNTVDANGNVTYYTFKDGSTTEYEFKTINLSAVPRLSTLLTKKADDTYNFNYSGANGYKTSAVWKISNADDMVAFSIISNWASTTCFCNKWVFVENDIDMTGCTMQPIGMGSNANSGNSGIATASRIDSVYGFCGFFDGLGHSIKNLKMTSAGTNNWEVLSLFGCIGVGVVQNLVIDASCEFSYTGTNNATIVASLAAVAKAHASLSGQVDNHLMVRNYIAQSRIGDTQMTNPVQTSDNKADSSNVYYIFNVENNADVSATAGCVGGLVANTWCQGVSGLPFIQNCTNNGNVTATGTANMYNGSGWTTFNQANAGGVLGFIAKRNVRLLDCVNNGTISSPGIAGGIWAGLSEFEPTANQGGARQAAMGCVNNGAVTGGTSAGGIVGQINKTNTVIRDCTNTGVITATSNPSKAGQLYGNGNITTDGIDSGAIGYWNHNKEAIGGVTVDNGVEVVGIQKATATTTISGKDYRSVRLVGAVNLTEQELADYASIGFEIRASYKLTEGGKTEYVTVSMIESDVHVYTSILAQNANGTYDTLEAPANAYYFAIVLENIPCAVGEVEFQLTPCYTATNATVTRGFTEVHTANLSA